MLQVTALRLHTPTSPSQNLNVSRTGVSAAGILALTALTGLRSLDVHGNYLGAPGAAALAALTDLLALDAANNSIDASGAAAIAAALTSLTSLNLGNRPASIRCGASRMRPVLRC